MNLPRPLSAQYKDDFAYPTVKDRLPVILTKAIDTVYRKKNNIVHKHGEEATEDLKIIVGHLSRLKHEMLTGKPLSPLTDDLQDVLLWNSYLNNECQRECDRAPSWFVSSWLYVECYFYRRIQEAIRLSHTLKELDPFEDQKQNALLSAIPACEALATYLQQAVGELSQAPNSSNRHHELFDEFMQLSLWGNKCDLSISAGVENTQKVNAVTSLESLQQHLLCNDLDQVWSNLNFKPLDMDTRRIDIVLDNAGFELFTDFCLADFLVESKLATQIYLHGKTMPWFVSDVTKSDLNWTLEQLQCSEHEVLRTYGHKWTNYFKTSQWKYLADEFWTKPYDVAQMETCSPSLYRQLSSSLLLIFKGDLNYRKLTGDLKWDVETRFTDSLRCHPPAPLCALRTLKCDLIVGISKEQAHRTQQQDPDWMLTGRWGVIQFSNRN